MTFGDRNPADVLKEPMWQMFWTFGQRANIPALKENVYALVKMATQKDMGQDGFNGKKRTSGNITVSDDLHMTLWSIVMEATALVLSGELDGAVWHDAEADPPDDERTTEYIVKDPTGIISWRLWHPDGGWGRPGRSPREEVKEWAEMPRRKGDKDE